VNGRRGDGCLPTTIPPHETYILLTLAILLLPPPREAEALQEMFVIAITRAES